MPENLDKYLKNQIIAQKWFDGSFYFKTKSDSVSKSYKLNINNLRIIEENFQKIIKVLIL